MGNSSPFPHLLKLLDDPSDVVRVEIRKALLPLAPELAELLKIFPASDQQLDLLERLLLPWRKSQLLTAWPRWRSFSQPQQRLEAFHQMLCEFEFRWRPSGDLGQQLDLLSERLASLRLDQLPAVLFAELKGDTENYYAAENSYLCRVIERGRGNPISLCSILMLVGRRLGLDYRGCSFPGHFLARFQEGDEEVRLVDCFRGGKLLDINLTPELRGDLPQGTARELARKMAPVEEIAARVLRNLVAAYVRSENRPYACLFDLLLKDLIARGRGRGQSLALREPLFTPGEVVRHRQKAYRGVVIDYELYSEEEDQPHLPLYRILVHGSPQVASADESQLELDAGGLVAHQLVGLFFSRFEDGVYVRNSRPWEGAA